MNPCLKNEECEEIEDESGWLCDDGHQVKKVVLKEYLEPKKTIAENIIY